ncbi:type II toxin-antitoxin system VapC family toxin [Coraliomargarita parva]|uniref:type II toxin-antitoxin system VapC family toxin n=1 Tax=Coraliomargarita parva TaxID=3014050 RepID=UPI0022B2E650|nr:type II toxin-antitoxin system VapC family toxin [Coraliomargarita parva]
MVIDSHALLWWLEGRPELSERAKGLLDTAEQQSGVYYLNAVTFWELRLKELRGQLRPSRPMREWPVFLRRLPWLQIQATTHEIWLSSAELDWPHRDPADRILAATALHYDVPVLTKDRVFHESHSPVQAVW